MKKVFKGIAILAATAAVGTGVAFAAGCGGTDGKYIGYYAYDSWSQVYGMVVEVTVENNIITKVVDVTKSYTDDAGKGKIAYSLKSGEETTEIDNTKWHTVSTPWETYYKENSWLQYQLTDEAKAKLEADSNYLPSPDECKFNYNWFQSDAKEWSDHEAWLLQQYEGKSVADILDVKVNIDNIGQPYETKYNSEFDASGLVITNATQGSGRVMLAVQNALGKTVEIGRVK